MHLPILGRNTFTNRANYILTWHRLNIATHYSNRFVPNLLNHYTNLGRFLGTRKAYRDYRLMAGIVPKPTIKTGIVGKSNYTQTPTEPQISSRNIFAFVSPILPVYTHVNINRVRLITSYILPFLSLMNMRGLSDIFDDLLWLFFIVLMLSFQPT